MTVMTIHHLFNRPSQREAVARLIYEEFWTGKTGYSPAYFAARLRTASSADRIPLSLVAMVGGALAGTVNLIDNDDEKRSHLHPWLAALIVRPEFRGGGIGSELVRSLLGEAKRLGFATVYFGTDGPGFYVRLGATVHEQVTAEFFIMKFSL
jgi:predicted N-acetyltransferase YhbS